jgi:hypothetical protein
MIQTLDQAIVAETGVDLRRGASGFYRAADVDESPKALPLIKIPDSGDEDWAPSWHLKTKRVHALGCNS